jgi:uncharacterized damage-inducible protein DinB
MSHGVTTPEFARLAVSEFTRYFRHMAQRVDRAARSIPPEQLWTKPLPFGNSIGHLILHLTGNLNHYVGALIAGTAYARDREHEFKDSTEHPRDELLARFHDAVELVARTLDAQDAAALASAVPDQPPISTRLGLFLVCAAHMNNHIGQMNYIVQALGCSTNEPAVW